jgi:hypothetical protein
MNFDIEFNKLIDVLKDIAENLRRIAFEIENLKKNEEDTQE